MLSTPTAEGRPFGGRVLDSLVIQLRPVALRAALPEQPSEPDVAGLMAAARRGDEVAFTELYRRYADRVYRFCLFRVRRPADAEDLMQQTFLRAIEALPRYEERGLPFGAWLFRIARNVVIDHERSRRDALDLDDLARTGADPAIEDVTGGLADRTSLLGAIARLTPDQREVLGYRFFADLSARETGRLMGRGEATVRGLQVRALAALRRELAAIEGGGARPPGTSCASATARATGRASATGRAGADPAATSRVRP